MYVLHSDNPWIIGVLRELARQTQMHMSRGLHNEDRNPEETQVSFK